MTIVESRYNSAAVSTAAQGKLQVMPFWKKEAGFEFYRGKYSHPDDNLSFRGRPQGLKDASERAEGKQVAGGRAVLRGRAHAKFYAADGKRLYGRLNETPRWNRASARIRELVLRSVSTS